VLDIRKRTVGWFDHYLGRGGARTAH
jgi:hypothetical protein